MEFMYLSWGNIDCTSKSTIILFKCKYYFISFVCISYSIISKISISGNISFAINHVWTTIISCCTI